MKKNIFEELQEKKTHLVALAKKAKDFGWITDEREREIVENINRDVLTIGVIGQMKCGKSTFLNSFVFEDDILPAATTPMTAALSVITYGEEKKVVAEFYNKDEWSEQKLQASRSLDDVRGNSIEESKVKAAKELVEKAYKLGTQLDAYLGKIQDDSFENLIEYVGVDGKFISITKSVTIYYPKEYLKGIEIVDTPGFNDPIISREERTKSFLKKADVVLMMLYAGRPFDATDRDILFQNVGQCGVGKVIIGINKYDIPYENGEGLDEIKNYVKDEIRKACKQCGDNTLVEILKQADPILLSAEMALLSTLPMSKITKKEEYQAAWKRHCNIFEIGNQEQMFEKSFLGNLTFAVKHLIEEEKGKILFTKPINAILATGNSREAEICKSLRECEYLIESLSISDDELEEKLSKLEKAKKRLLKKNESLGEDIESTFINIIRKGEDVLEDEVISSCEEMHRIIDCEFKLLTTIESLSPKLDKEYQVLRTRKLKRNIKSLSDEAKTLIFKCMDEYFDSVNDILMKYLPADSDTRSILKSAKAKINMDIGDKELFSLNSEEGKDTFGFVDFVWRVINGASWGVLGKFGDVLSHNEDKTTLHNWVNSVSGDFNPKPYLETILENEEHIIQTVQSIFIKELIEPMIEQIEDIRQENVNKEVRLEAAKVELTNHKEAKRIVISQIEEVSQMKTLLL